VLDPIASGQQLRALLSAPVNKISMTSGLNYNGKLTLGTIGQMT
jgi:hypothetical protein